MLRLNLVVLRQSFNIMVVIGNKMISAIYLLIKFQKCLNTYRIHKVIKKISVHIANIS